MKLLIIGKTPPPIGGVTIHVKRLLGNLKEIKYPYDFIELSLYNLPIIFIKILFFDKIHIHSSNVYFKLFISMWTRVFNKKLLLTNHGNLGRYGNFKDYLDKLSIRLCYLPIVLNDDSYLIAKNINKKVVKISSFLPPVDETKLDKNDLNLINNLNKKYVVCCTNASAFNLDKNGNDIYGIEELILKFKNSNKFALIISDPSGDYLKKYNNLITNNIYFISKKHSFFEVIKHSKISIRNTTTDGDSLSIKESLYLNKLTLATNCVSRPKGVLVYTKFDISLLNANNSKNNNDLNGFMDLINLYNNI